MRAIQLSTCFLCILHLLAVARASSRLVLVQSIIKHGDRNPIWLFPTDTANNNESTWENGFGELTPVGIANQYELGRFIKRRYSSFLSEKYSAKEIYVRSTDTNRTIMSALAKLAGMYPPVANQVWNASIPWMPIPVHSTPLSKDPLLWMDCQCNVAQHLYQTKVINSDAYQKVERENAGFFEFVRRKTGFSWLTLFDFWKIYDTLYCLAAHNDTHKLPSWVSDDVFQKVKDVFQTAYAFSYHLPEIQRFRGALLFNEIAGRNMEKIAKTKPYIEQLKYYMYSAHDNTQAALLQNLKASDGSWPTYSQVLLFELHENNGSYFVELYKKNDTRTDVLIPIKIPECGEPCLASKFHELSQWNVPADYDIECGNTSPTYESSTSTAGVSSGTNASHTFTTSLTDVTVVRVLAGVTMMCFLLFLFTLIQFCKLKKLQYVVGNGKLVA